MNNKKVINILFASVIFTSISAQVKVGINTYFPLERRLEMFGNGNEYLRLQSTSSSNNFSGLELVRGVGQNDILDWRIHNGDPGLAFVTSTDDFNSGYVTRMILKENGYLGIGTLFPETRLDVKGGSSATNAGGGYLQLGPENAYNITFDQNGFISKLNGSSAPVYIQTGGGDTRFGSFAKSNVLVSNGRAIVGGGYANGLLNISDEDQFGLHLRNNSDNDVNIWNISTTADNWTVGPNQLIFTPSNSSAASVLRLYDVNENDGSLAPVIIRSSASHSLLLDGNEIDSYSEPLNINDHSDHDIYINSNGGKMGVGTINPQGIVHIESDGFALSMQRLSKAWQVSVLPSGDMMFSNTDFGNVAYISVAGGGQWIAISDSTRKENISLVNNAMDKISRIHVKRYNFRNAENDRSDIGVIAQELEKIVPEAVSIDNGQYGVMYDQLSVLALAGVQEQQQRIEALIKDCSEQLMKAH